MSKDKCLLFFSGHICSTYLTVFRYNSTFRLFRLCCASNACQLSRVVHAYNAIVTARTEVCLIVFGLGVAKRTNRGSWSCGNPALVHAKGFLHNLNVIIVTRAYRRVRRRFSTVGFLSTYAARVSLSMVRVVSEGIDFIPREHIKNSNLTH